MDYNLNRQSAQQQRCAGKHVQYVDANRRFNLLTGPELLKVVESQLPEHREQNHTLMKTLSMFCTASDECRRIVAERGE